MSKVFDLEQLFTNAPKTSVKSLQGISGMSCAMSFLALLEVAQPADFSGLNFWPTRVSNSFVVWTAWANSVKWSAPARRYASSMKTKL